MFKHLRSIGHPLLEPTTSIIANKTSSVNSLVYCFGIILAWTSFLPSGLIF